MAVARPRRSMREGVQAPVARITRSAEREVESLSFAPRTRRLLGEKWRDVTSPVRKVMRPVDSAFWRRYFMPSSASAQPDCGFMYPQSPEPPPVPTASLISFLVFSSRIVPSDCDPESLRTFSKLSRTYFSPCFPLSATNTNPHSEYRSCPPKSESPCCRQNS